MSIPLQLQVPKRMKSKRAEQRPKECDCANQERAMKKIVEIKFREEGRSVSRAPKKGRGQQSATDYDGEKVGEQFGGIFQGR
jgi:hypothetical protein